MSHSTLYKWQGTGELVKEHPDQSSLSLSPKEPKPKHSNTEVRIAEKAKYG